MTSIDQHAQHDRPVGPPGHLTDIARLLERAAVGILEFDTEGRATYVNEHWRLLAGYRGPLPIDGDTLNEIIHPDDRDRIAAEWAAHLGHGGGFSFLARFRRPDATVVTIHARIEPLVDAAGEVTGYVGSCIDAGRAFDDEQVHREAAPPVGQAICALDGTIEEASPAFAALLGTVPEELVGLGPAELWHPEDLVRLRDRIEGLARGEEEFVGEEVRVIGPDGQLLWVVGGATLVRDADGAPAAIQVTITDISSARRAATRLEAAESRHRTVVEALHEGVLLLGGTRGIEAMNDAAREMFGIPPDLDLATTGMVEAARWGVVDERGTEIGWEGLPAWEAIATGTPRDDVVLGIDRPGRSRRWLRTNIRPIQLADEVTGAVVSISDITDEKETQDRLEASEARYRALVDSAPVGQLVAELDGRVIQVNAAYAKVMGREPDELVGLYPWDTIHEDDLQAMGEGLDSLLAGAGSFEVEYRALRPDGAMVWVTGPVSLIRDHEGAPVRIHAFIQDITERKVAEEALRRSEAKYRNTVDSLHEGVLVIRGDRLETVNRRAIEMLGAPDVDDPDALAEFLAGLETCDAEGRPMAIDRVPIGRALVSGESVVDELLGVVGRAGDRRWYLTNAHPILGPDGSVEGALTTFSDITARKEAQDRLRLSEERYRRLVEAAPIGQLIAELDGSIIEGNDTLASIVGVPRDEMTGIGPAQLSHPDDLERLAHLTIDLLEGRVSTFRYEGRLIRPGDGALRHINANTTLLRGVDGEPTHFLTLIEDVTEWHDAEEEALRLAGIVESTSDLVGVASQHDQTLLYLNRAGRSLFRLGEQIEDVLLTDLLTDDAADRWRDEVSPTLVEGGTWTGELAMRRDDDIIHVQLSVTADHPVDGAFEQLSFVGRDITEKRRREEALAHQATHDPLTDLPNRALLLELLERGLGRAARAGQLVAVLFLDLDRFKSVNDNLGHEAGDALLIEAAERIAKVLRPTDVLARLGGDEFVVLSEDIRDEHQAVAIAQRVSSAIETRPFFVGGAALPVTASIGIALSTDAEAHPESLLRDADAAMYRAKDRGRARHELFDEAMRRRSAQRLELADDLADAIEQGQITVHYQPVIDLRTGEVNGVEALARWEHPTQGTLPPLEFIGLAEETGLIVGLGLSVLSQACHQMTAWEQQLGHAPKTLHVNLSARQMTHTNLPRLVEGVLHQADLDADRLCLEITESVLMEDAARSVRMLEELKHVGVDIAIDDFGTGYSSLAYLRRFPVDVLKIDRSFVDGLGPDADDSAIVSVIVGLARTLSLTAVAEGVETAQQLAGLQALGCELAQGFYFARPAPADDVVGALSRVYQV